METQNQVKRTLEQPASIEAIRAILARSEQANRSSLVRTVCGTFGLLDGRGGPQIGGCSKALRELERAGHFVLPASTRPNVKGPKGPRRLDAAVPAPLDVPEQAGEVLALELIKVCTLDQIRLWNEMMAREHPQGAGPLVGAQMRYLIGSAHGWLGGLGFGASAIKLGDRDQWIGWDVEHQRKHLHRVIGMSRFLIRPSVRCHNLASMVLGMTLRSVGQDFEDQYKYRPWLVESFVDSDFFAGTCYQATNWVAVGKTKGRGRQDREHLQDKTVKAIYVYPLQADFRARMGVPEPVGLVALEPGQGLDGHAWADQEFGGAALGDQRSSERLVHSARVQAAQPGQAFCAVAKGDWPAIKGYYRFIDQPDDSPTTVAAILAPHRKRTVQRMKAHSTVLCIQDGTDLNYCGLAQCEGLGSIGTNQTGASSAGLHLHSTLVVTTDGLPLGLLQAQLHAPSARAEDDKRASADIPIEEKKTFDWIHALRDCVAVAAQIPHTQMVCVMDREADFFELFDEQRKKPRVELLVRAKHDRKTVGNTAAALTLFDAVRQSPLKSQFLLPIKGQSARPKRSKQKARDQIKARTAQVELRYCPVTLRPPAGHDDKLPLTLWVVHVRELSPPVDTESVEWFLLTTCELDDAEDALACVRWYCLRWRIEDWHRVLKSGCAIEALAHKTRTRLERAIAIRLVIGWRIMLMTLLGRTCPGLPAQVLFSDIEIEVLTAYAKKTAGRTQDAGCSRPPGRATGWPCRPPQRPPAWS